MRSTDTRYRDVRTVVRLLVVSVSFPLFLAYSTQYASFIELLGKMSRYSETIPYPKEAATKKMRRAALTALFGDTILLIFLS